MKKEYPKMLSIGAIKGGWGTYFHIPSAFITPLLALPPSAPLIIVLEKPVMWIRIQIQRYKITDKMKGKTRVLTNKNNFFSRRKLYVSSLNLKKVGSD